MGILHRGQLEITDGLVEWVFTDRVDGASRPPFDSANLAWHVGDDPTAVRRNRERLAGELFPTGGQTSQRTKPALASMSQVHGNAVRWIHRSELGARGTVEGSTEGSADPEADALLTADRDVALVTQVADCVPILLACPEGVIAAIHSGWRGVVAGVVDAAIDALPDSTDHRQVRAWIGPAICPGCYEVGEDVRDAVAQAAPDAHASTRWGRPAVDVQAGVAQQLRRRGINAQVLAGCTYESDRLYSYRRDGRTGRQAGVIVMRSPA